MLRKYLPGVICCLILLLCTDARGKPGSDKFRGVIGNLIFLEKSTGVCTTSETIYYCEDNALKWKELSWPEDDGVNKGLMSCVGGTEKRLFFVEARGGQRFFLKCLEQAKPTRIIREIPQRLCSFASDLLGCFVAGSKLLVTSDGGETWQESKDLLGKGQLLTKVLWVSPATLIIGGDQGTVSALTLNRNGKLRSLWSKDCSSKIKFFALGDGKVVWVYGKDIVGYNILDGEVTSKISPDIQLEGLAASKEHIYLWGFNGVSIWQLNDREPVPLQRIDCAPVAHILAKGKGGALIISMDGTFLEWNSGSKDPRLASITVTHQPQVETKKAEDQKRYATKVEMREMVSWSQKVPFQVRQDIFAKANEKKELTPKERMKWAIAEFKKIAPKQK